MNDPILLVEDDQEIRELLSALLIEEGFEVDEAGDGLSGEQKGASGKYSVIILDIMLPEKDGLSVLRDLRAKIKTPILMLTAKGDDLDRILGFEMGADDYLPKPFNPRELLARVKALIRRVHLDQREIAIPEDIHANNLKLSVKRREVTKDGALVELTSAEFNVLHTLMTHPNEIISRDRLTQLALDRKLTMYDRAIDMHLSNLRKKLSDTHIKTVRGSGYMYQIDSN